MIAANYRKHPQALLQLELALVDVRETMQWIRINRPTVWGIISRQFHDAPADVRGTKPVPAWVRVAKRKAAALSRSVKTACMALDFYWAPDLQLSIDF